MGILQGNSLTIKDIGLKYKKIQDELFKARPLLAVNSSLSQSAKTCALEVATWLSENCKRVASSDSFNSEICEEATSKNALYFVFAPKETRQARSTCPTRFLQTDDWRLVFAAEIARTTTQGKRYVSYLTRDSGDNEMFLHFDGKQLTEVSDLRCDEEQHLEGNCSSKIGSILRTMHIYVYEKKMRSGEFFDGDMLWSVGSQELVKCGIHSRILDQMICKNLVCVIPGCKNLVNFKCQERNVLCPAGCTIGVCNKHMKLKSKHAVDDGGNIYPSPPDHNQPMSSPEAQFSIRVCDNPQENEDQNSESMHQQRHKMKGVVSKDAKKVVDCDTLCAILEQIADNQKDQAEESEKLQQFVKTVTNLMLRETGAQLELVPITEHAPVYARVNEDNVMGGQFLLSG